MNTAPKGQFWTVSEWMAEEGMSRHAIELWVSPEFLGVAKAIEFDHAKFLKRARRLVTLTGWEDVEFDVRILFGEYGVHGISVPGNCACIGFDPSDLDVMGEEGAALTSHNIDGPSQQSMIMTIWMMWAKGVEAFAYREAERRGDDNQP